MSRSLVALTALSTLLGGCGGGPGGGPPDVLYGEDVCDRCRMVISEPRHAAGAALGGRDHRFDDPGCLLAFLGEQQDAAAAVLWVHDESESWLPAEEALYVVDPEGFTPMGSGILAFGSAGAAAAAAERYGNEPRRWTAVVEGAAAMDGRGRRPGSAGRGRSGRAS